MNRLLALLLAYLFPGVDDDLAGSALPDDDTPPGDDDTPPADDDTPPADDDDTPPADDDTPPGNEDEPPAPRETRAQKAIRETRERAQAAEAALAEARAQLEAARRPQQPQGSAQPDPEQALWEQEEAVLRNPEAQDWQRYAVNANRAARAAARQSAQALANSQDMADRTAFQALAATNPKTYAAYKDRVEEELKKARANGHNPSRQAILKLLLGEDMLAGKLRSATTKKPATPAAPRRAASDVPASGRGRLSDAEAREKRLENVRI